jgi:ankyrin repeat protein
MRADECNLEPAAAEGIERKEVARARHGVTDYSRRLKRQPVTHDLTLDNPDIFTAAALGDHETVARLIEADPASATEKGGPKGWDPLTCLAFSKLLRTDTARSADFVRTAEVLLDAGADPNTGFYESEHLPNPTFESVLYGASGVAHHSGLTKLLLDRGADPNDGETEYHSPEGFDNRPMEIIVESGKLAPIGLTTMLHRKLDWTNLEGVVWLLEHGADPNAISHWGHRALDHSIGRDNSIEFMEKLLDHGADPRLVTADGVTAFERAAGMGRADVLDLFAKRGFKHELKGEAAFLEACARGQSRRVRAMLDADPTIVERIQTRYPGVLANFAGAGNVDGVKALLDFGFDIESRTNLVQSRGDTALHLAVWRGRTETVKLLIERGAAIEAHNRAGYTPLAMAVTAMTEMSEWTPHESTDIVAELLKAGADTSKVRKFPSGSEETDDLLRRYGRNS